MVVAVVCVVVAARRPDAPHGLDLRFYLVLAAVVVAVRVAFRVLFGGTGLGTGPVVLDLPRVPLPDAVTGVTLLGPVTAGSLLAGVYEGLRLAAVLVCVGAANALADARRLLRAVPGALAEVSTAVVIALTAAPQLVDSVRRVRRARRLRSGGGEGLRALPAVLTPVLADALDRSLALAAAMAVRGYGRTAGVPRRVRATSATLLLAGLVGVCLGLFGLLDPTAGPATGPALLAAGVLLALLGLRTASARVRRTAHRPDPWGVPEWAVAATGAASAGLVVLAGALAPGSLDPSTAPPAWPEPAPLALVGVLVAVLPAVLAPSPGAPARTRTRTRPA
ncbi:CbiQ family ECF transporter T component [Pseudokineococcus basanitobsidens]|uniref:CbiQ family ECF transporter T component n=1 Tax=Pseudokineococcus basanitobsidens TaxID=1926649 RepID=A0ABU8RK44_9ACTN